MADDGIQDRQELSHTGRESDLFRLAALEEAMIESSEDGIVAAGDQGGHVKGVAAAGPDRHRCDGGPGGRRCRG